MERFPREHQQPPIRRGRQDNGPKPAPGNHDALSERGIPQVVGSQLLPQREGRGGGALSGVTLAWPVSPQRNNGIAVHTNNISAVVRDDGENGTEIVIEQATELLGPLRSERVEPDRQAGRTDNIEKNDAAIDDLTGIAGGGVAPHQRGGIGGKRLLLVLNDTCGIASTHSGQNRHETWADRKSPLVCVTMFRLPRNVLPGCVALRLTLAAPQNT